MASRFHSDEFSGSWDNANANDGSYTNTTNTNTSVSEGGDDDQDFDYYESGTRSHNMYVCISKMRFSSMLVYFLLLTLSFFFSFFSQDCRCRLDWTDYFLMLDLDVCDAASPLCLHSTQNARLATTD
jgi:hypothetical protein